MGQERADDGGSGVQGRRDGLIAGGSTLSSEPNDRLRCPPARVPPAPSLTRQGRTLPGDRDSGRGHPAPRASAQACPGTPAISSRRVPEWALASLMSPASPGRPTRSDPEPLARRASPSGGAARGSVGGGMGPSGHGQAKDGGGPTESPSVWRPRAGPSLTSQQSATG